MKKRMLPFTAAAILLLLMIIFRFVSEAAWQKSPEKLSKQTGFFFEEGTDTVWYHARFTFPGICFPEEIEVQVGKIAEGKSGILYDIRIVCDEDFAERYAEGYDRFWLGSFYVMEDKIYFIREQNAMDVIQNEEMLEDVAKVVCQETEKKDPMEGKKGLHESIRVNGNICEYQSYNDLTETGYYEEFIWEKGKGLMEYRSGFGAEKDGMELQIK